MKTYKHLWEKLISRDNIIEAFKNAAKGSKRKYVKDTINKYKDNPDKYVPIFQDYAENYENIPHKSLLIYDGISRKQRTIIVPTVREQILHHMIVNVLKPIIMKSLYEHAYGSIPNRGQVAGKIQLEKWLPCNYILKMDIKKYFESIDQQILYGKLCMIIKDDRFLVLLYKIITVVPTGLPVGFYTSQWLAQLNLVKLDYHIVIDLHAPHYIRYMDDMVVCCDDKETAHYLRREIDEYLNVQLHLTMKDNWQVFRFSYIVYVQNEETRMVEKCYRGRALDFMGYRFFYDKTILRKSIYIKACRKARHIVEEDRYDWYNASQFLSYTGWFKYTDTKTVYEDIADFVDVQRLKKLVSDHSKKIRKENQNENKNISEYYLAEAF